MDVADVRVVKLRPPQWRELRVLRLEALRVEPAAFSTPYEEAMIRLRVSETQEAARRLYESCGFRVVDRKDHAVQADDRY